MELLKTVPAYSWIFIYFRKYWNLCNIDVFIIKGFTVAGVPGVAQVYIINYGKSYALCLPALGVKQWF